MEGQALERLAVELAEQMRQRFYGKYRGIVMNTEDPQAMGRLQARVPEVLDESISPWALPCVPFAGEGVGQYTLPPLGAGVWIEFEAGDPARPVWTGCWWGQDQLPEDNRGAPTRQPLKIIRSETGLMVSMDDANQTIDVSDDTGKNLLKIEVNAGQVLVKGLFKVVVEAPQIELVQNATHPVVFGDQLLSYLTQLVTLLQTHTHPGQMAAGIFPVTPMIPVPTFPQPTPSLISQKVRSG